MYEDEARSKHSDRDRKGESVGLPLLVASSHRPLAEESKPAVCQQEQLPGLASRDPQPGLL